MVTKAGTPSSVSIHPSSFTDELPDMSKVPLEEVVARFKDAEKRRTARTEPDSEAHVFWPVRVAPVELLSSISIMAVHLGVSRSVLTKCMSRQVVDWYTNSLGLSELTDSFNIIYGKIKLRGYTTLRIQAEHPAKFSFAQQGEPAYRSVCTVRWVMSKMNGIHDVLGVNSTDLLLAGFCWSLTTLDNSSWDETNINTVFAPEARNMSVLVQDRLVDIHSLYAKFSLRESHNEKGNRL